MITFIVVYLFFSALVGAFATFLKRSGFLWLIIALIISPLLAFIALVILGNPMIPSIISSLSEKTCPQCAERIKKKAIVCRYCGFKFLEQPKVSEQNEDPSATRRFKTREEYEMWKAKRLPKLGKTS
jgi:DNA-directed RNA polymerase subunit RPC12/RpoP